LVLLALNWEEGKAYQDFLGFAIKRTPGFRDPVTKAVAPSDWLPNRLDFNGPAAAGQPDFPSDAAPIQKFLWWDARIDEEDRGAQFKYEIWPVRGTAAAGAHPRVAAARAEVIITLPQHLEKGTGTFFNRAVTSSQAFSRKLKAMQLDPKKAPPAPQALELRTWLANDLEQVVSGFLPKSGNVAGSIYHLTDKLWVIPSLTKFSKKGKATLVYDSKTTKDKKGKVIPSPNAEVIAALGTKIAFKPRNKTNIMHNKFLVNGPRLVCGSANYTTQGITEQANLMHTFDSAPLAALYLERVNLIKGNPALKATATANKGWSNTVTVGDAGIRAYFSPEPKDRKEQIETIVSQIHGAHSSVVFCLFTPTDADLRDACFSAGDNGLMMFGLVNAISEPKKPADGKPLAADKLAQLELYHRSRDKRDVIPAAFFHPGMVPPGFEPEIRQFPGTKPPPFPPVIIHHKFIVIDAETTNPTIYTGSANMSHNSVNQNDENLLEIRGSRRLAGIYLAEFMRLYEHYRARAHFIASELAKVGAAPVPAKPFKLAANNSWSLAAYADDSPESRARVHMAVP
jgi:phosphatidylserine/phosphatidylglycerophosphate/cardiolipin synthase-like enzyme